MIQSFGEGLDIVAVAMQGDVFGNSLSYMGNGFELLRQLAKEFSLRSRAEAMSLRAMLMARTFQAQTSSAPVADTVRQIEVAVARFVRLLSTLDQRDAVGLALTDSDQLTLLIRSLPESAKAYTLHHSQGETYASYRMSALRWEHQQRLFLELQGTKSLFGLHENDFEHVATAKAIEVEDGQVFGVNVKTADANESRCSRCGKQGHTLNQCTTDLSKVKCFKCNEKGHISVNCPKSQGVSTSAGSKSSGSKGSSSSKGANSQGSNPGASKGSSFQKGKGKGRGGKKGKLFAVFDEETGAWWYTDYDEDFEESAPQEGQAESTEQAQTLVLSCVLETYPEPNTRVEVPSVDVRLCQPLLQSLGQSLGSEYWLLDSGASCCVVNQMTLKALPHDDLASCGSTFMAANGTPVPFAGRCHVVLKVRAKDSTGTVKDAVCKVPVMVGDTPYNILSTRILGKLGWRVVLDEGVSVSHVRVGVEMLDTCMWCDTPWIRVLPHSDHELLVPADSSEGSVLAAVEANGHVAAVSQRTKDDLEVHRARGHVPYHPDCEHCVKSRGVTQHRRRSEKGLETEVVADFMFLDAVGESISVVERQTGGSIKVLVLREAFSSCIGAVVISEDIGKDRGLLIKWLSEFGLATASASVTLLTDAEEAVKSFVTGASDKYAFMVRKAAPQAHEQIGGAERTVRVLKEGLATLQSDFQSLGCVLSFRKDLIQLVLTYLCMSTNSNGKAFGSERSPKEVAVGRALPETIFALFGSKVLAEVPDSVKALCPNMSRFEVAAFLHPQFGSLGSLVFAYVRVGHELMPKVFVAKSIKLVFPIELVFESGMFDRLQRRGELGPAVPAEPAPAPRILPSSQGASLKCPVSGPPKEYFERYGFSEGCSACSSMARRGTRKGLSHSRACCLRYEAWLRSQVSSEEAMEVEIGVPVAPEVVHGAEGLREALSELANDEARQDRAVEPRGFPEVQPSAEVVSSEALPAVDVSVARSSGRLFTRGCPSCETGMNAPGIRHNAECKRRNQSASSSQDVRFTVDEPSNDNNEVEQMPLPDTNMGAPAPLSEGSAVAYDEDVDMPMAEPVPAGNDLGVEDVLRSSNTKRSSEVPVEELEREMQRERDGVASCMVSVHNCESGNDVYMPLESFVAQAFQVSDHVPLLSGLIDSVQFAPNATSVVVPFGKRSHLRVWQPKSAIDDSTLGELPGDQVMEGMVKEVNNLSNMGTGDLLTVSELQELEKRFPGTLRVIPSRWVTTRKTPTTVRARIVIKDIAGKNSESARALGISSPTPSADALFTVLGIAGCRDCFIASGDVSHAFMATPLRERDVVMKFPLSVSTVSGEPLYMHLKKALNGLRKASQEWICLVAEIVKGLGSGLRSCSLEPCLFSGMLESGPCLLLVYVDDFLCIAMTEEDIDRVFSLIETMVELKRTGLIRSSRAGGGSLRFIGRVISRRKGESSVIVSLPEDYLDETFKSYGLTGKGSSSPPDVSVHVEKQGGVPLTPEAYGRFRSALGKVAWMTQTRQDLRAYISILATQQAAPTNHTEHGLRSLLRFLQNDMGVVVRLPASGQVLVQSKYFLDQRHLVCFSDASHAPLRTTKRRGVSGGVLAVDGFVVKTLCRHEQMVSLSSMESELFALQSVAQEMSSLGKFLARVFGTFYEESSDEIPGVLFSDSESSLKLLKNMDTPKRSRHLEIRIEWLKDRVACGKLILAFRKGVENPSDLLTKCLGSAAFGLHRESLGFESLVGPLSSLTSLEGQLVLVEVCCRKQSNIMLACRKRGLNYVGVTENMQSDRVFKDVKNYLKNFGQDRVFVHVSTPCSSGSPLRRLHGPTTTEADWEWFEIFPRVLRYLRLGKHSSFELPWNNEIWRHALCQRVLRQAGHAFDMPVKLCMTGLVSKGGEPIGKVLGFSSSARTFTLALECFSTCQCAQHAPMNQTCWTETGFSPEAS